MGRDRIKVEVVEPTSQLDALTHAIKMNAKHGLGLSSEELKRNAIRLWKQGATEKHIVATVSRSEGTVQGYLAEAKQKLKEKQQQEAVELYKDGYSQTEISKIISKKSPRSINQKTVSNYLHEYLVAQAGMMHEEGLTEQNIEEELKRDFPRLIKSGAVSQLIEEYTDSKPEPEPDDVEEEVVEAVAEAEPTTKQHAQERAEAKSDVDEADEEQDKETERVHSEMQWMLLWLGNELNLNLWLPKADFTQSHQRNEIVNLAGKLEDLPFDILKVGRPVQRIDVIWLKENKIIAAFEIENSTGIESGLFRMSHLWVSLEDSNIRTHIVAQDNDVNKAGDKVSEPTFKHNGLAESCWFVPYTGLTNIFNDAQQNSSLPYTWQELLDIIGHKLYKKIAPTSDEAVRNFGLL